MKKTLKLLTISGIACMMAFLTSCEKKYYVAPPPPDPTVPVSYEMDMQPFFDAKCIDCHNGGGVPLDLTSPGSYENLLDPSKDYIDIDTPENSSLYTKIIPGGSMESFATQVDRDMTLLWIEQGAKDN